VPAEYLTVPDDRVGLELDEFLCLTYPHIHKGFLRAQVRAATVLVDGQPNHPGHKLKRNEVISVEFDDESAPRRAVAPNERLRVLHEDESTLAIDKPAGLAVEPERWARDAATVAGALIQFAEERAESNASGTLDFRPRLVHRLDKDTTGVLLAAKNLDAERVLRTAFDERTIDKRYLALVEGEHHLEDGEEEVIDAPIAPDPRKTGRMRVHARGKASSTSVGVEERFKGYTLMRCRPHSGRTHQIRVHLAEAGFPLAIDPLYGRRDELMLSEFKDNYRPKRGTPERPLMDRLTLHARSLGWPAPHAPETPVRVESPIPKDLERVLKQMRRVRPFRN
jgi:23S rRNA pseudouridine1911/1915/1917 synthase